MKSRATPEFKEWQDNEVSIEGTKKTKFQGQKEENKDGEFVVGRFKYHQKYFQGQLRSKRFLNDHWTTYLKATCDPIIATSIKQ